MNTNNFVYEANHNLSKVIKDLKKSQLEIELMCNKQSRECLHVNTSKSLHIHGTHMNSQCRSLRYNI